MVSLANLYRMYAAAAWNARDAGRDPGRAEANAAEVERAFARDAALTRRYHEIAGGKWAGMMNQVHIGYTRWNDPPADVMPAVSRGPMTASPTAAEDEPAERVLAIPAARFTRAEGGGRFEWTRIANLGHWGEAPLALPQGRAPTSPEDGAYLEYRFPLREAGDYALEVSLVPTLDTIGAGGQRFGLQVDDAPVEIVTVRLEPTGGGPETPTMQAWYDAVIANRIEVKRGLGTLARGEHRLRLYRIDDNVIPQALFVSRADPDQSSRATQP